MSRQTLDGHGVDVVHPGRSITALVVVLHRLNSTPTKVRSETALEDPARARGWLLVFPSRLQVILEFRPLLRVSSGRRH